MAAKTLRIRSAITRTETKFAASLWCRIEGVEFSSLLKRSIADTIRVLVQIPTWHGWVALKLPRQCNSCERVVEVVSEFARKSFHDHDLRMCASFALVSYDTGSADAGPQARVAMPPLLGSPPEPVLVWLPPMHELHNIHERPVV